MNVWEALETLCGERNPKLVVIIEVEDAQEIIGMRRTLIGILDSPTEKKITAAKKLLGRKT